MPAPSRTFVGIPAAQTGGIVWEKNELECTSSYNPTVLLVLCIIAISGVVIVLLIRASEPAPRKPLPENDFYEDDAFNLE